MRTLAPCLVALSLSVLGACGGSDKPSNSPLTSIPLSTFTGDWVNCTPIAAAPLNLGTGQRGLRTTLHISLQGQALKELRSAEIFASSDCTGAQILVTENGIPLPNKYLGNTTTTFYETTGVIQIAGSIFNQAYLFTDMGDPLPMQALLSTVQEKLQIALMNKGAAWDSPAETETYIRLP